MQTNVAENVTTTLIKNDDLILQLNALSEKKMLVRILYKFVKTI